jgi:hypothetical protein
LPAEPSNSSVRREWLSAILIFGVLTLIQGGRPLWIGSSPFDERLMHLGNGAFNLACLRAGTLPLWNPYAFCGMPQLAGQFTAALYPPQYLLFALLAPLRAFATLQALHYFWAGLGVWTLLRRGWGLAFASALVGGALFMFSGFMLAHEAHGPMVWSAAWAPWIFWQAWRLRAGCRTSGPLLALMLALQLASGYMQVCVTTWFVLGAEALWHFVWNPVGLSLRRRWQGLATLAAAFALGLGILALQLMLTYDLLPMTFRGQLPFELFASHGFFGPQWATFFFPLLLGAQYTTHLVPQQYFSIWDQPEMIGTLGAVGWLGLLLCVVVCRPWGRVARRSAVGGSVLFWLALMVWVLCLLPGTHSPLARALFHVPVLNLFRVIARWLVWLDLPWALCAAWGVQQLLYPALADTPRALTAGRWLRLGLGLLLLAPLLGWAWTRCSAGFAMSTLTPDFPGEWWSWRLPAIYIPLAFVSLALLVGWVYLRSGAANPRFRAGLVTCLLLLICAEQMLLLEHVGSRRFTFDSAGATSPGNQVAAFVQHAAAETIPSFRVLNTTANDIRQTWETMPCFLPQLNQVAAVGGNWPLMNPDYSRLTHLTNYGLTEDASALLHNTPLLAMLNVRYVLVGPFYDGHAPVPYSPAEPKPKLLQALRVPGAYPALAERFTTSQGVTVFENTANLPPAWFVDRVTTVASPDAAITRVWTPARLFAPAHEALLQFDPDTTPTPLPVQWGRGSVALTRRSFDKLWFDVDVSGGLGFLVLSQAWYPGWWARLDGRLIPLHRVNASLSGLIIPPGRHQLYLRYLPLVVKPGALLSAVCLALSLSWLVLALRTRKRSAL